MTHAFHTVIDLLPEPMLLVHRSGRILAVNRAARQRLTAGAPSHFLEWARPAERAREFLSLASGTTQLVPSTLEIPLANGSTPMRFEGGLCVDPDGTGSTLLVRFAELKKPLERFHLLNEKIQQLGHEVANRQRTAQLLAAQKISLEMLLRGAPLEWVLHRLLSALEQYLQRSVYPLAVYRDQSHASRVRVISPAFADPVCRRILESYDQDPEPWQALFYQPQTRSAAQPPFDLLGLDPGYQLGNLPFLAKTGDSLGALLWSVAPSAPLATPATEMIELVGQTAAIAIERSIEKEQLETAIRSKDHFLAVLSHELRTPLSPVLMNLSILHKLELPPQFREVVASIERNVRTEVKLIDDLLDLTRMTHSKISLSLEPVRVHELLQNTVEVCRYALESKQLKLQLCLDAAEERVYADPLRLQQVFWNVLQNAAKFSPPQSPVTIRTTNLPGKIWIQVCDEGPGIPESLLPVIFRPFEQADPSGNSGLGLGLAISRASILAHRGEIRAESPGASGTGTTIHIQLPLHLHEQEEGGQDLRSA